MTHRGWRLMESEVKMIIAVDFDGTLALTKYPEILAPNYDVMRFCRWRQSKGDTVILYTCRHGDELEEAIEFCKEYGLIFDYINENPPERIAMYGDCRKIYADMYIDDHNVTIHDIPKMI